MRILVSGSSGHLGEALARRLPAAGHEVVGIDVASGAFAGAVGSIVDRGFVRQCLQGVEAVVHAATLHKPHVATHARQQFLDVNVAGTLVLLEEAVAAGVGAFVFTSSTSAFGDAMSPPAGSPAVWIDEDVAPIPKNIYGVTKAAAETLCELFARRHDLPCVVLRTSRFFLEPDDEPERRAQYADENVKLNELLSRRVDVEDVVSAHARALERAVAIGFGRYVISATTPFGPGDLGELRVDAPAVLRRRVPGYEEVYRDRGWRMFPSLDRVYVNARARKELGWQPRHDFASALARVASGGNWCSELATEIGVKGYHGERYRDGLYPVA